MRTCLQAQVEAEAIAVVDRLVTVGEAAGGAGDSAAGVAVGGVDARRLVAQALDARDGLLPAQLGRQPDDDDGVGVAPTHVHRQPLLLHGRSHSGSTTARR